MATALDDTSLDLRTRGENLYVTFGREPDTGMLERMGEWLVACAGAARRIFIDVRSLRSVSQSAAQALRSLLSATPLPAQGVYFKGELGFSIAGNGNRVIVSRPRSELASGETRENIAARRARLQEGPRHHHCDGKGGCGGHGKCHGHCHCHHHDHDACSEQAG